MVQKAHIKKFQDTVWKYYREHGRHELAWRHTTDPYRIMVSEIMLQQTQVSRVIEKYQEFLATFPTVEILARSNLAEVLNVWSGMGYNRRAKFLKSAAEVIVSELSGKVPQDFAALMALPGIGQYTASAIRVFAHNLSDVLIETNIRAVYIHHFYCGKSDLQHQNIAILKGPIWDRELMQYITDTAEGQDPREWHWALMDYGSYLKKIHPNPSRKSATYTKQSKFEGSRRQVRGAILKILKDGPQTEMYIVNKTAFEKPKVKEALTGLAKDKMIKKEKGKWEIV